MTREEVYCDTLNVKIVGNNYDKNTEIKKIFSIVKSVIYIFLQGDFRDFFSAQAVKFDEKLLEPPILFI